MNELKPGLMVNYVVKEGKVYPAIVTRVWSSECVNLRYFMNGDFNELLVPVTSVLLYISEDKPNTWHYRSE